ncbi:hypothetical protein [Prevotella sp. AGR2160]|uniref:hypothetical protein n=1 Tax=Prevotella sp. AGR2160 TaxID=1280674 RepID=UPI0003F580D9|nr:hypothetical protein [Prevotella sp. AGR2160]
MSKKTFWLTVLLAFLALCRLSAAPELKLSATALTATINQYKFTRPQVSVVDGTKDVTNQFYLNYYVKGQESNLKTIEGKKATVNPVTGTSVSQNYGIVKIGSRAGVDTIRIIAKARADGSYAGVSDLESVYTITIPAYVPDVVLSQDSIYVHSSQLFGLPTATLYGLNDSIVNDYYDVSYSWSSGISKVTNDPETYVPFFNGYMLKAPASVTDGETLTMTYTPKSSYAASYGPYTHTFNVRMYEWDNSEVMPTHMDWPQSDSIVCENGNTYKAPVPVVRDKYGNDVSLLFTYKYELLGEKSDVVGNMWTSNNAFYGSWYIYVKSIINGEALIRVSTYRLSWNSDYQAPQGYAQAVDTCKIVGRKITWTVKADPASFHLYAGNQVLSKDNWALPTITVYDQNGSITNDLSRRIGIPVGVKVTGNTNGAELNDTVTYRGVRYVLYRAESWCFPHADYGTWKIDYTGYELPATAENAPFMIINILPNYSGQYMEERIFPYGLVIDKQVATHFRLSESALSGNIVNGTFRGFNEPDVSVRDGNGDDVTSAFSLAYTMTADSSVKGFSIDTSTGKVSYDGSTTAEGMLKVTVSATLTDKTGKYTLPADASYTIRIALSNFDYEIISDATDSVTYGKFHFTGTGKMSSGTVINGIPGLSIQFGEPDDAEWVLGQSDDSNDMDEEGEKKGTNWGKVHTVNNPVAVDDNGVPDDGMYVILRPYTNGFISIDCKWTSGNLYQIIEVSDGKIVRTYGYEPVTTTKGTYRFPVALNAGHTYYFYNYGSADGSYSSVLLHGINYQPAFIAGDDAKEPSLLSTTFVNGYTGTISSLLDDPSDRVSFALSKEGLNDGVDPADYLSLDASTGAVIPKKNTSGITKATTGSYANRILIQATVWNKEKGTAVVRHPRLYLFISDIPSYIIQDGEKPSVGERVSTTNMATKITMTFGGWKDGSGPYKYRNKKTQLLEDIFDSWKEAKTDTVGQNGMTIDGFLYASQGTQDARDEDNQSFQDTIAMGDHLPWELPCRGTYLTFEPEENGTLILYLLQNGALDYTGSQQWDDLKAGYVLKYRPLFIMDENDREVPLDNSWVIDKSLLPSNSTQDTHAGSYTEGLYRSTFDDSWATKQLANHKLTFQNPKAYQDCPYDLVTNYKNRPADLDSIMTEWKKYDGTPTYARQEIINLPQGYTLVSKAYVRYTFQVKAGKTYFVFQKGSKLSPCGFSFVPEYFHKMDPGQQTVVLNDDDDFKKVFAAAVGSTATELKNVNVKINRKFGKGKWTGICLPFSIGPTKFKAFFGDQAQVITFDSIADQTGYFSQHVYHMLVANRPFFICPSKNISSGDTIKNVSVEADYGALDITDPAQDYSSRGIFAPETAPGGSYIFAGERIYHTQSEQALAAYRAYLKPLTASPAKMMAMAVADRDETEKDGPVTDIKEISMDEADSPRPSGSRVRRGIWSLQGAFLGDSSRLQSLPPGIYIVNGKKVIR